MKKQGFYAASIIDQKKLTVALQLQHCVVTGFSLTILEFEKKDFFPLEKGQIFFCLSWLIWFTILQKQKGTVEFRCISNHE